MQWDRSGQIERTNYKNWNSQIEKTQTTRFSPQILAFFKSEKIPFQLKTVSETEMTKM